MLGDLPQAAWRSSPHTRRYFQQLIVLFGTRRLFSAHAEVFPARFMQMPRRLPLLRTRGGISGWSITLNVHWISSPHTRRYFLKVRFLRNTSQLFSAHAEVFPGLSTPPAVVSSSPHTRRYFRPPGRLAPPVGLFSAHAEVFPTRRRLTVLSQALLRTRGGISRMESRSNRRTRSSPHTRRYFLWRHLSA